MKLSDLFEHSLDTYKGHIFYNNMDEPQALSIQGFSTFEYWDEVRDDFKCIDNAIISLRGAPAKVGGMFVCRDNELRSLLFCPQEIGGWFDCSSNDITSLKGLPKTLKKGVDISGNKITSLEGCQEEFKADFDCTSNELTDFKGGPKKVIGNYNASWNKITSLEGCPYDVGGDFSIIENQLTSLQSIHKYFKNGGIAGKIEIGGNPIKSHILGLLLIPDLMGITVNANDNKDFRNAVSIIINHLNNHEPDLIDCQQELIEAGLKAYAQL